MSREKQIAEMARDIFAPKVAIDGTDIAFASIHGADKPDSHFMRIAQHLYNAGYRKHSEPISCGHEKGGEWISIDERVPEKRQRCLCYYPEKDYGSKVVVDYAETDNGGFAEQFQFGKPSHWMPIPEAPVTDTKNYPPYLDRPKGSNFQKEKGGE